MRTNDLPPRTHFYFSLRVCPKRQHCLSRKAACHGIRQPPECCTNASNVMDDVTNTMNTAAAAEPQQPAVRVRVVDATTRKTMTDEAEVVFVPCAESEPIKLKNAALSQLPARRYLVKATAPGYAQLNYLEGPINIYHDHLVVDQEGRPQK